VTEPRDYWTPDGATFVHYGEGYRVSKTLETVNIGKYPPDKTQETIMVSAVVAQNDVAKPPDDKVVGGKSLHIQDRGSFATTSKNSGGRPKKEGEVSRFTTWRLGKQGVLL
jgi:hypothetical protein